MKKSVTALAIGGVLTALAVWGLVVFCRKPDTGGTEAKNAAVTGKPKAKQHKSPYVVDELPAETVLIRLNGAPITRGQYSSWLSTKAKLMVIKKKKKLGLPAKAIAETRESMRFRSVGELVRCELVRQYAKEQSLEPTKEQLKAAERRVVNSVGDKKITYSALQSALGQEDAQTLAEIIRMDALDALCLAKYATNDLTRVSDEDLRKQIEYVKKWNETAAQKNKESFDKARKAKAEILSGAFFADVAKKYAEVSPEDGAAWDTVELSEFQAEDPIVRWLVTAKPGDISDPMEYDDVIAIFGLLQIQDGEAPEGIKPQQQYQLVRCAFHAYETMDEVEDPEELRQEMLKERKGRVFQELGIKLTQAAKFEFPMGEKIFNKMHKKPGAKKKKTANGSAAVSGNGNQATVSEKKKDQAKPALKETSGEKK